MNEKTSDCSVENPYPKMRNYSLLLMLDG